MATRIVSKLQHYWVLIFPLATPNKKPCRGETDAWGTTWPEALPGQTSSFQCKGGDTIGKNIAYRPRKFFVFGSFICPAKPDGKAFS